MAVVESFVASVAVGSAVDLAALGVFADVQIAAAEMKGKIFEGQCSEMNYLPAWLYTIIHYSPLQLYPG